MTHSAPVLFLIFNRPECTFQVFEKIRAQQPRQLFIAADGPRKTKPGEKEKCDQARSILAKIDWPCEVHTLLRDENLGCKQAVGEAITWFFEHVESGIILEDDCVPDASFFTFSTLMLERYKDDTRVTMICGTNFLYDNPKHNEYRFEHSYFFSNYYPIWGWATWRRAWANYDITIQKWPEYREAGYLYWLFPIKRIANHYKGMFDLLYYKGFNTWDIQWWFVCIFQHGLSIVPKYNLIRNIGAEGTHTETQGQAYMKMPVTPLDCKNLVHPSDVYPNGYLNKELYRIIEVLKTPKQLLVAKIKLWLRITQ